MCGRGVATVRRCSLAVVFPIAAFLLVGSVKDRML